jgi:two-component system invasion response regulator UvrY
VLATRAFLREEFMPAIRVLIADDHPLIVEGISAALLRLGFAVVGSVASAEAVLQKYAAVLPDVLVLDVRFGPGPSGLDVGRQLLAEYPKARIVFYSQFDQDAVISEAYRLGGAAFITKNTEPAMLAAAVSAAFSGTTYFLPRIAERLALLGLRQDPSPASKLESREIDVFTQLAQGLSSVEISERMKLSTKTISIITQSIKEKLGVHRPAELTRLAVRHGLIEP